MIPPKDFWEISKPTYIENWPKELCSLSFAQVDVPLSIHDALALGSNIVELGEMFAPKPIDLSLDGGLVDRVDAAVKKFPNGAFIRLGSRSPKDSWTLHQKGAKVTTGPAALDILLGTSERVMEDLLLALKHEYQPHIFIRQWVEIPKHMEFRCFLKKRRLVGISQYDYFHVYPELKGQEEKIRFAVESFLPDFLEAIHLDDVVFDVFVKSRTIGNETIHETKLVEINPFSEMTDPCLFDWRGGGDFDDSVRFKK
jgi:hypothetical protein